MAINIGATMKNLFGANASNTSVGNPPQNPNQQPQNQLENQQQNTNVRQQAPSGEFTQLEQGGQQQKNNNSVDNTTPVNPLDKFKEMWQPPTSADGKPLPGRQPIIPKIDPAKIMEFAGKQDFKKFVKPETLAAIAKGGEEGSAAFQQAIQDIGSSTFASSITASSQMMSAALERQQKQFEDSLPELFKRFSLGENLSNKNPVLKHPAAKPIIDALQIQLAQKYPDASAADLQRTAEEFITAFASEATGKKQDSIANDTKGRKQDDWSTFLPDYLK
jgi:hypothetical protein